MLSSQQRNTNGSKLHLCKHANAFASVVEAVQEPTAQQSGVAAHHKPMQSHRFIFMPSPSSRSMAKPTGSMVKEQLQKCESKGIAASQHTRPPKDYGIKTQPQHTEAIIFIPFPFGLSHLPQRLVAKHFLLHFIFYHY